MLAHPGRILTARPAATKRCRRRLCPAFTQPGHRVIMAGMSQDILFPLEKVKVKTLKASFTEQRDKPELNDYDTFVKLCNQLISVMAPEVTCAQLEASLEALQRVLTGRLMISYPPTQSCFRIQAFLHTISGSGIHPANNFPPSRLSV